MFNSDIHFDALTSGELLTEIGIDPHTVLEIIEEDRAMRCPDRPWAGFGRDTPLRRAMHENGIADIDSASRAFPPAQ